MPLRVQAHVGIDPERCTARQGVLFSTDVREPMDELFNQ